MGWFDSIFGDADDDERIEERKPSDPFGRIEPEPQFDAFRRAWKAAASLFDLFGDEPMKIKQPVGPEAPNRRPDVAKVETFLGRTGHLDLAKTEGPTGYYGSRVDHGVRGFQKDNALKVDGLINPGGPTIVALRERLDAALVTGRGLDPCLGLWLDARAATERVLAIGREIEAKKDERRDLEAQIEALDSGSPGTYAPTPSLRRPSPGGRSRGARWRDAVGAIGEASGLGADLQGADEYVGEAQARREAIASARGRITSLNGEIAALERDENAALAEERRTGDIYDRCRQENR